MYVVTVEFRVGFEHVEDFRTAMMKQAANSLQLEEQCRQFDVCFDPEDGCRCFLYERYDDRAAFDAHLKSKHFQEFDATVGPWIETKTVNTWLQAS